MMGYGCFCLFAKQFVICSFESLAFVGNFCEDEVPNANTHDTLEFRLDGTKINRENNTSKVHIVIKQEEKGNITLAVELRTLVSYDRDVSGYSRCREKLM